MFCSAHSRQACRCLCSVWSCRWLEQQQPSLPAKVFRKVQDDGRYEFTLSRTRANWRRLILLREATAPARAVFWHLCSWENTLHSGGWYCVILLLGVYPSKVLSGSCVALLCHVEEPVPVAFSNGLPTWLRCHAEEGMVCYHGHQHTSLLSNCTAMCAGACP